MPNIDEVVHINSLLDVYGRLLTESQLDVMKDYYQNDLSLSEISELRNISRTAVSDMLKQARQKLENYEEKIGLLKGISSLKGKDKEHILDELLERIKNGI